MATLLHRAHDAVTATVGLGPLAACQGWGTEGALLPRDTVLESQVGRVRRDRSLSPEAWYVCRADLRQEEAGNAFSVKQLKDPKLPDREGLSLLKRR